MGSTSLCSCVRIVCAAENFGAAPCLYTCFFTAITVCTGYPKYGRKRSAHNPNRLQIDNNYYFIVVLTLVLTLLAYVLLGGGTRTNAFGVDSREHAPRNVRRIRLVTVRNSSTGSTFVQQSKKRYCF